MKKLLVKIIVVLFTTITICGCNNKTIDEENIESELNTQIESHPETQAEIRVEKQAEIQIETQDSNKEITDLSSFIEVMTREDMSDLLEESNLAKVVDDPLSIDHLYDANEKTLYIFGNKYYDVIFGKKQVTLEETIAQIENNKEIPDEYKEFIKEFVIAMTSYYENLDLRAFAYNIGKVKMKLEEPEVIEQAVSGTSAYFDNLKCEMVVSKYIDLSRKEEKSILRHELAHLFNNVSVIADGVTITNRYSSGSHGYYVEEGLNVIFSSQPFLDEYGGIMMGYYTTTNYLRMLLSVLNYNFNGFVNGSIYSFEFYMDIACDQDYSFNYIVDLLDLQWEDIIKEDVSYDTEFYYDLYEYVSNVYFEKKLSDGINREEARQIEIDFIKELMYLSAGDMVNLDAVDDSFNRYCRVYGVE